MTFNSQRNNPVPPRWTVSRLGDEFTLQRGFDITVADQRPGNVPVVSSSGITSFHDRAMVRGPGVVIGRKGQLGNAYYLEEPFWPHDTSLWVKDFHGNFPKFGAYFLRWLRLERFDAATSVPTLNRNFVHPLPVVLPPFDEQRRIVEILRTLDEAIQKTEQVIVKLKHMKRGLLHDLLTRGIAENGELRDPDRHPEQFKKSPLGQIPREWDVVLFGKTLANRGGVLQTGPFGSQLHAHEYVQGAGVPVVMPQDIGDTSISVEEIARISPKRADKLSRHKMAVNDVVFARRGDLSRCAAIEQREAGWICGTGCLLARLPVSVMGARWFSELYRHDWLQRQIARRAVGSTMVNLNTGILAGLLIPLPLMAEQVRIAEVIRGLEYRYSAEGEHLQKLHLLKLGLMDDLLTGRVSVTPLLAGSAQ